MRSGLKRITAFIVVSLIAVGIPAAPEARPWTPEVGFKRMLIVSWGPVLEENVVDGRIDYEALKNNPEELNAFIDYIAGLDLKEFETQSGRLSFWINAYNALAIKTVVDRYPVDSVKKIPGFFKRIEHKVANRSLTLDEIGAMARSYGDFRVHFALVPATSGCQPIRSEPYGGGADLDEQLDEQARAFLSDESRGLRIDGDVLYASRLFDWNLDDFLGRKGWGGLFGRRHAARALLERLAPYLPGNLSASEATNLKLKYLDYDWSLNEYRVSLFKG